MALSIKSVFLAPSGLLLIFFCNTKSEKIAINDDSGSGGMLLKSNTEAPGEEVVRETVFMFKQIAERVQHSVDI